MKLPASMIRAMMRMPFVPQKKLRHEWTKCKTCGNKCRTDECFKCETKRAAAGIVRVAMLILAALALLPTAAAHADDYVATIATQIALVSLDATPTPGPTPPAPSGICENCKGTGKLGDGTVSVPCPVCGGDGRLDSATVKKVNPKAVPLPCSCGDNCRCTAGECGCDKPSGEVAVQKLPDWSAPPTQGSERVGDPAAEECEGSSWGVSRGRSATSGRRFGGLFGRRR